MQARRLSAAITALAGVALLALTQFFPWGVTTVGSGDDPSLTVRSDLYGAQYETANNTATYRWWGEAHDGDPGIRGLRLAIPLLGVGLVAALASGVMIGLSPSPVGPALALVTGIAATLGVWLFAAGLSEVTQGTTEWHSGFWFAAFAAVDLLLAGLMGFVAYVQALRFARFEMDR